MTRNPFVHLVLEYPFVIATGGTYQVQLDSRIDDGTKNAEANDTFLRLGAKRRNA